MFGLRIGAMGRVGSGLTLTQAAANVRAAYSTSPQVWYDPSDLSTLYQDSAGTTPVTAVGQPVGLMLDKSRGLVLGSELVTNGDFSGGLTDWTSGSAVTSSEVSGEAQITFAGSAALSQNNWFSQGEKLTSTTAFYKVTFDATWISGGVLQLSSGFDVRATISANAGKTSYSAIIGRGASGAALGQQALVFAGAAGAVWRIDNISVRELPGLHASQPTALARPVLQQENGLMFLLCDGTDDGMVTPSWDLTSTDKVTVVAGVRKLSDAAGGVLLELSVSTNANPGSFFVSAPNDTATQRYGAISRGAAAVNAAQGSYVTGVGAAPDSAVLTGLMNIAGDSTVLRRNGAAFAAGTADQGTGTYGNYPLYLFRRGGSSLPFNGRFYGLSIIGAQLSASDINVLERYTATKTGVTLP